MDTLLTRLEVLIDETGFAALLLRDGVLTEEQVRDALSRVLEELETLRSDLPHVPTPPAVLH